jgi:hypothetical protein
MGRAMRHFFVSPWRIKRNATAFDAMFDRNSTAFVRLK